MIGEYGFNYPNFIELSELFDDNSETIANDIKDVTESYSIVNSINDVNNKKKQKRSIRRLLIRLIIKIVITVIVIFLLLTYVIKIFVNHGNSSYPMIKDGDLCITLLHSEISKGDMVAIDTEKGPRFMRVEALAGDSVNIDNGCLFVNGYIIEDAVYETTADKLGIDYPYIVPDNCVFVLNDYRVDTYDSRNFGAVLLDDLNGEVVFTARKRGI